MPKPSEVHVEAALKNSVLASLTEAEKQAVLEVAFLSIASDRRLGEEEIDAFFRVSQRILGESFGERELDDSVERYGLEIRKKGLHPRLLELASELTRPMARDQAYQLAYTMALSDLDTNDEEFAFDLNLQEALGISHDWAETLADDVLSAFQAVEDRRQGS